MSERRLRFGEPQYDAAEAAWLFSRTLAQPLPPPPPPELCLSPFAAPLVLLLLLEILGSAEKRSLYDAKSAAAGVGGVVGGGRPAAKAATADCLIDAGTRWRAGSLSGTPKLFRISLTLTALAGGDEEEEAGGDDDDATVAAATAAAAAGAKGFFRASGVAQIPWFAGKVEGDASATAVRGMAPPPPSSSE